LHQGGHFVNLKLLYSVYSWFLVLLLKVCHWTPGDEVCSSIMLSSYLFAHEDVKQLQE
jgi:hypothetical protein